MTRQNLDEAQIRESVLNSEGAGAAGGTAAGPAQRTYTLQELYSRLEALVESGDFSRARSPRCDVAFVDGPQR